MRHGLLTAFMVIAADGLVLMNELPTPSFVIDMQSLQRHADDVLGTTNAALPPLLLPFSDDSPPLLLLPDDQIADCPHTFDSSTSSAAIDVFNSQYPIFYLHSKVIRARDQILESENPSVFLAQIDLTHHHKARLCLGLNNHHVVSYYWARSAGAGAAMDAPGVVLKPNGVLQWESERGPQACNSNDGKRSEWVNFLRVDDNVQLVPLEEELSLAAFIEEGRVFGISSKGRPMGSEPQVVCRWKK